MACRTQRTRYENEKRHREEENRGESINNKKLISDERAWRGVLAEIERGKGEKLELKRRKAIRVLLKFSFSSSGGCNARGLLTIASYCCGLGRIFCLNRFTRGVDWKISMYLESIEPQFIAHTPRIRVVRWDIQVTWCFFKRKSRREEFCSKIVFVYFFST